MIKLSTSVVLLLLGSALFCQGAPNPRAQASLIVPDKKLLYPLPAGEKAVSSHSAYDTDKKDCSTCHKNKDPLDPGPILTNSVNGLCIDCHEDFKKITARKFQHKAMEGKCTLCHNPHDAKNRKLLIETGEQLCLSCHEGMKKHLADATVKHDALTTGPQCLNCHNPHATDVEHLLIKLPFDLCLQCHGGTNEVADHQGKPLTNFKSLLATNSEWHAPVASKDCSACHNPHGSANFRILSTDYPPAFYSGYDAKNYALCFECHNDDMLSEPETTTKTQFRNGSINLHYLHVNKPTRGRTCRACHEIHASPQKHQIRTSVPYGPKAWPLQLNFTQTPTGGSCEKTCHATRSYTNTIIKLVEPVKAPADPAKTGAAAEPSSAPPSSATPPAAVAKPADLPKKP